MLLLITAPAYCVYPAMTSPKKASVTRKHSTTPGLDADGFLIPRSWFIDITWGLTATWLLLLYSIPMLLFCVFYKTFFLKATVSWYQAVVLLPGDTHVLRWKRSAHAGTGGPRDVVVDSPAVRRHAGCAVKTFFAASACLATSCREPERRSALRQCMAPLGPAGGTGSNGTRWEDWEQRDTLGRGGSWWSGVCFFQRLSGHWQEPKFCRLHVSSVNQFFRLLNFFKNYLFIC